MTTGQHLVALSGLPSASALAHLLGIQTGSGTGETLFTTKIFTTLSEPTHSFTQRATNEKVQSPQQAAKVKLAKDQRADVFVGTDTGYILTSSNKLTVTQLSKR